MYDKCHIESEKWESQCRPFPRTTNMKMTKPALLFSSVMLCSVMSAVAGDSGYTQHTTCACTRVHSKWDDQPRAIRILGFPFVFLGRVGETVLHSPQIPAEAMEGDRPLVSRRGVLAPREVPVEDCILSPAD